MVVSYLPTFTPHVRNPLNLQDVSRTIEGTTIGVLKGDARSLDYGSYKLQSVDFHIGASQNVEYLSWGSP